MVNWSRQLAQRTSEMKFARDDAASQPLHKLSFSYVEGQNRLIASTVGYHRAYQKKLSETNHLIDGGKMTREKQDELAHKAGLNGARAMTELTQFEYHRFNDPEVMRTPGQKAFFQFKKYTWNHMNMLWRLGKDARKSYSYGTHDKALQSMVMTYGMIGSAGLAEAFLLGGASQMYNNEVIDKLVNTVQWLSGDEDAFFGQGGIGALKSIPAPTFQYIMDFVHAAGQKAINGELSDNYRDVLHWKYGLFSGQSDDYQYNAVPGLMVTPHDLWNIGSKAVNPGKDLKIWDFIKLGTGWYPAEWKNYKNRRRRGRSRASR